jgi:malonate-semialdehyde dehydrogenase (acetylating)/methylmalonate-semialdehyde dehydrogenase
MKYSTVQNYINGQFVDASSTRKLPVISPVDGNHLSDVPMSTGKDPDDAVKAAKAAIRYGFEALPHFSSLFP